MSVMEARRFKFAWISLSVSLLCALLVVLFGGGIWWSISQGSVQAQKHVLAKLPVKDSENEKLKVTGLQPVPLSLTGTIPDGKLRWDQHNNLVINDQLRLVFDYFFSGYGEESLAVITGRIRAYLDSHLPEPAVSQARAILDDYLQLQEQLVQLKAPGFKPDGKLDDIATHLQQLRDIRRTTLSPELADAFYAEEEKYDQYTLQVLGILNDPTLSGVEKSIQGDLLTAQLPITIQQSLTTSRTLVTLNAMETELGADAHEERDLMRRELVGNAAADRLATLDQQRAQWQQRVADWLVLRDNVLDSPQLTINDKQEQLAQLRRVHFSESEQLRVQALERIHHGLM